MFSRLTDNIWKHVTLRNAVFALGALAIFVFIGSLASARIAFLLAALVLLAGLAGLEMQARRKWEQDVADRLESMDSEYARLARDVARSRGDLSFVRKSLADAGATAKSQAAKLNAATGTQSPETRMLRAIADQLSKLNDAPGEETADETSAQPLVALKNIADYNDHDVVQLVRRALKEDMIDLFLQPIVALPQRKARYFETFSRIKLAEGIHMPAERYIGIAAAAALLPALDNMLLLRTLQHIRDTEQAETNRAFFCNIASTTLSDPKFMGDLVEFIAQNRSLAPRLVFEMSQQDLNAMGPDRLPVLQGLAKLGCRFSMDRVEKMSFNLEEMEARHIRFLKIEAPVILHEMREAGSLQRLKKMKSELDFYGIDLIIEKIEGEKQVRELLDLDVDYGQGYLFGRPAAAA